jgi:hypothetical protein
VRRLRWVFLIPVARKDQTPETWFGRRDDLVTIYVNDTNYERPKRCDGVSARTNRGLINKAYCLEVFAER